MSSRQYRTAFILASIAWVVLLLLAFACDLPVARHVAAHPPFHKGGTIASIVKWPGNFWFTLAVAGLLATFHRDGRRAALHLILAAASSGLLYSIVKWVAGRPRPVPHITPFAWHPFIGGLRGLWSANDLGFPSGHAALSFATAMCLTMALPRWRWVFFIAAAIVGCERIGENAHYVSDVIAGAGIGLISAFLVNWSLNRLSLSSARVGSDAQRSADVLPQAPRAAAPRA